MTNIASLKVSFSKDGSSSAVNPQLGTTLPVIASAVVSIGSYAANLVTFEIIRDYWQVMSLFFSGVANAMPSAFRAFYGNVAQFFNICFSCWFTSVSSLMNEHRRDLSRGLFIVKFLVGFIFSILFYVKARTPNQLRFGLETKTWEQDRSRARIVGWALVVITTLYLPLARDCMDIFSCDLSMFGPNDDCNTSTGWVGILWVLALGCFLIILIPMPIVLAVLVKNNKPKIKLYDEEGNVKVGGFNDDDYRRALAKDVSPFRSLYDAYERKWAFFKVVIMVVKVVLVVPVALLVPTNRIGGRTEDAEPNNQLMRAQSITLLVILGSYCIMTVMSTPFLDPFNDILDGAARVTHLAIALIGLLAAWVNEPIAFAVVLNILSSLTLVLGILLMMSTVPAVNMWWKNFTQRCDLTMHRFAKKGPVLLSDEPDLGRQRKLRIWHEFWDVLFSQAPELKRKDPKKLLAYADSEGAPPYLLDFDGTPEERLRENAEIAECAGINAIRASLTMLQWKVPSGRRPGDRDDPTVQQLMDYVCTHLQGVDVFWDGAVEAHDGANEVGETQRKTKPSSSATHFGKLYITPFPFVACLVFDDTDDFVSFTFVPSVDGVRRDPAVGMSELGQLIAKNRDPEILRRKDMRMALRAMSGKVCQFHYECTKAKTKHRTVQRDGKSHTESYTVHVHFTFNTGTFSVTTRDDIKWTDTAEGNQNLDLGAGLICSLHYADGHGVDHEGKHWTNEQETIGHSELGITPAFTPNPNFDRFFVNFMNDTSMPRKKQNLYAGYSRYRQEKLGEYKRKEDALSYAFWLYIFNNDRLSKHELEGCLARERNAAVKGIPQTYGVDLGVLYEKLRYFDSHPSIGVWFAFWHDVWANNRSMKLFKDKEHLISPMEAKSLCYTPMTREKLTTLLKQHGLQSITGGGFMNNILLDKFYAKLYAMGFGEKLEASLEGLHLNMVDCSPEAKQKDIQTIYINASDMYGHIILNIATGPDSFQTIELNIAQGTGPQQIQINVAKDPSPQTYGAAFPSQMDQDAC
eukprot:GDKI01015574.1.p1 GENE.GDKI01015574.1~~GDKI01015574.1.p1  ORF type:complete len:1029 (+),score=214.61 GDKI01015574.1:174-3260(+)